MSSNATHETGAYQGDPQEETLQRMRRLETRVSNLLRSIGMTPGSNPPDALAGRAFYEDGVVYATSGDVTIGELLVVATRGHNGKSGVVKVILHNQLVGALNVHGKHEVAR